MRVLKYKFLHERGSSSWTEGEAMRRRPDFGASWRGRGGATTRACCLERNVVHG